ncbi:MULTISPECIES: hypothetical protein [unclassified Planococcus (in: firmicutes)]|uniref:hypothetical protein n=1 Tax=unclassified Planococcus (in: firmicutes) TaxID=2662419 RepID=UPI000C79CF09|nr:MULTISPECIES: hypothetical protein [unclassified Planococcus (in: firmicutes)]PKG47201.1 hypothetical protein CXF66_05225 [Planococcus sp. Urea-trap-24]PKG87603.1 hypothetical protein CXF91_16635 [Planococcus sp. Urea-3u-39]PKH35395.1 hypothetical protein CXF77_17015 [Planococcus sp. MB-3u-09]
MMEGLTIGSILAGMIASLLIGGGIVYKVIKIKKKSNKGIEQNKGTTQIALQKSKGNSINVGKDINNEKKGD